MADLLCSLRGRVVTVTFGAREVRGKLLQADPVTLVGPGGEVTVIAPGMVISVQF